MAKHLELIFKSYLRRKDVYTRLRIESNKVLLKWSRRQSLPN